MNAHEYVNDFLYFSMRPDVKSDKGAMLFCSGINLDRFMPLVRMRCGIGGNPILSGLRLINFDICARETSKGATFKVLEGGGCQGVAPTKEAWYTQSMLIENGAELSSDEIIDYGVKSLVDKIVAGSALDRRAPDGVLTPGDLQVYLQELCAAMPVN